MEPDEKMKFKIEPENNVEMLLAVYQSKQPLLGFGSLDLEFEKHIMESENKTRKLKNLSDVRIIKTEGVEMLSNESNDYNQMLLELNNNLWELKKQILEKDRVFGAYQAQEEMKLAKMEKEIEELKVQKQMDDRIIEDLGRRLSVLEEEKKTADRIVEEMRRRGMEAERGAKVIASELLKANETVKEMRRSVITEPNVKANNNKLAGKTTGTVSHASSGDMKIIDDDKEKEELHSNNPVCANDRQSKKRREISTDCCHVHRRLSLQQRK